MIGLESVIRVFRTTKGRLLGRLAQALRMDAEALFSASHLFHVEASLRRCLFLLALVSLAFWRPATICPTSEARGDGGTNERLNGWRRTEFGWEEASRWHLNAPPVQFPSSAAAVHPLVIASLELMISVGALLAGSPSPPAREERR